MPAKSNDVRLAFGRVLSSRFDGGHAAGTKTALGELIGGKGHAASNRVSRMLGGEVFPDRDLGAIADFVGMTAAEFLRAIADEIEVPTSPG